MKVRDAGLEGVLVIEPVVHRDDRGFFVETYHREQLRQLGLTVEFVQDNHSSSGPGILRGLHAQSRKPQGKLVRVVEGEVFDVAVDIRRGSPTFGRWVGAHLSAVNFLQLWIPPGFAHGFCVIGAGAQVVYKCTDFYDPSDEITVVWNDPAIGIDWPLRDPRVSPKDQAGARLDELTDRLPRFSLPRFSLPRSTGRA